MVDLIKRPVHESASAFFVLGNINNQRSILYELSRETTSTAFDALQEYFQCLKGMRFLLHRCSPYGAGIWRN
jgi:hypothetical protein